MDGFISIYCAWILITTIDKMQNNFNILKNIFKPPSLFRPFLHPEPPGNHLSVLCFYILIFFKMHINGILQYEPIQDWVLSLIIVNFFIFERMFIFAESQMKKEERRDWATAELKLIAYCGAERSGEVTRHCWNAVFLYVQQELHLFKAFGFWFAISIFGIFKYMSSRGMMGENSPHYWLPLVSA